MKQPLIKRETEQENPKLTITCRANQDVNKNIIHDF